MGKTYIPDLPSGIEPAELSKYQRQRIEDLMERLCVKYRDVKFPEIIIEEPPFGAYLDSSKKCETYFYIGNNEVCQDVSYEEYLRAVEEMDKMSEQFIKELYKEMAEIFPDSNLLIHG